MEIPYAEVIGDPIAHSKSPLIHKFWLEKLGMEEDFRAVRVEPEELFAYLESRRGDPAWRGCSVTAPHKQSIISLLDDCQETGSWGTGAVNCVVPRHGRLTGINTDTSGVAGAFPVGLDTDAPVCVIGAGGAASAAIVALDVLAVYQFNVVARNEEKALALLKPYGSHGRWYPFEAAHEAIRDCVGLINATPLGMIGYHSMEEQVLRAVETLRPGGFVFDMVYTPPRTELLARGANAGLRTIDGLTMLVGQAEEAFHRFFGVEPPVGTEAALRELLTS